MADFEHTTCFRCGKLLTNPRINKPRSLWCQRCRNRMDAAEDAFHESTSHRWADTRFTVRGVRVCIRCGTIPRKRYGCYCTNKNADPLFRLPEPPPPPKAYGWVVWEIINGTLTRFVERFDTEEVAVKYISTHQDNVIGRLMAIPYDLATGELGI